MSLEILFLARCSGTIAASIGKRFQCFTSVHAEPFLLLLVLLVWWRNGIFFTRGHIGHQKRRVCSKAEWDSFRWCLKIRFISKPVLIDVFCSYT